MQHLIITETNQNIEHELVETSEEAIKAVEAFMNDNPEGNVRLFELNEVALTVKQAFRVELA